MPEEKKAPEAPLPSPEGVQKTAQEKQPEKVASSVNGNPLQAGAKVESNGAKAPESAVERDSQKDNEKKSKKKKKGEPERAGVRAEGKKEEEAARIADNEKIKELLKGNEAVTEAELEEAAVAATKNKVSLSDYLIAEGKITKDVFGEVTAKSFKIPYADINSSPPYREQVLKIPEKEAKKLRIVLFKEGEKEVTVSTDIPTQKDLTASLSRLFPGKKVTLAYSLTEDVDETFIHYRKPLETQFSEIIKTSRQVAPKIVGAIIDDALAFKASDIHFEPQEKEVNIRFRIDGVLHEAGRIHKDYYESILNRLKVQSHLRIDEHFKAQDGAIRFKTNKVKVDLRLSIIPTLDGEKVVIRVLSQYVKGFTLANLGLNPNDQKLLTQAAKKPFGMILVTGPTGSGKTTTLYALMNMLNKPGVNVTTIEDPVEYKIPGLNQIQVNKDTELTFSLGLRSIVRQDPDIILVGEIRDEETAEIAINAALTGHLLLSTFHANDAATAVPRLLDMAIEPFLLSSTLLVVVAQRLVRKICESCKYSETVKKEDLKERIPNINDYFDSSSIELLRGKGCKACGGSEYKGRVALFEFIYITPEMQEIILKNPSSKEIWDLAKEQGAHSLFDNGMDKVKEGVTTVDEVLRVAAPSTLEDIYGKKGEKGSGTKAGSASGGEKGSGTKTG